MATIIEMPKLSDTMTVGTLIKWHKKSGDVVANGDILAEVETDKATMELENFDDGTLLEIFVHEGDEVPIGSSLAVVGEPGEKYDAPKIENVEPESSIVEPKQADTPSPENKTEDTSLSQESTTPHDSLDRTKESNISEGEISNDRISASPLARKMAKDLNLDINNINGSGPNGRIIKKDILDQSANKSTMVEGIDDNTLVKSSPVKPISLDAVMTEKLVPVSKMRSIIAKRLLESKSTIPHFYLQKEINATPLLNARLALNSKLAKRQSEKITKLTLNDIILKACAETIPQVPEINSSWEGENIRFHGNVHIAFGVAVEDGLVTPVIRDANSLNLEMLSIEAKSLIVKARSKKLNPNEMSGSTFTVTNLGMFGIDFFSGIINPPNSAILSVGAIVKKPVVNSSGNLQVGETMMLGLSCDHRLVDGALAATFLKALAETLENPASMLV